MTIDAEQATIVADGSSIVFRSFGDIINGLIGGYVLSATRMSWTKGKTLHVTKPIRIVGHHDNLNAEVIHGEERPNHAVLVRHLMVSIGSELFEPYTPTQSDMFAQDWVIQE